jgi:hypothetical protein
MYAVKDSNVQFLHGVFIAFDSSFFFALCCHLNLLQNCR